MKCSWCNFSGWIILIPPNNKTFFWKNILLTSPKYQLTSPKQVKPFGLKPPNVAFHHNPKVSPIPKTFQVTTAPAHLFLIRPPSTLVKFKDINGNYPFAILHSYCFIEGFGHQHKILKRWDWRWIHPRKVTKISTDLRSAAAIRRQPLRSSYPQQFSASSCGQWLMVSYLT